MIEVRNLEKSYDKKVIERLNFRLEPGETALITGASGAGKTTLLRLLLGLEKPDAGEVRCEGERFSVVFQENRLLERFDIVDNLKLTTGCDRETIFAQYCEILPQDAFSKRIRDYSGGMKRRAAVLRAVLSESTTILLDEPFQGLDEENRRRTMQYILDNRRGRTLILVAHDAGEADAWGAAKQIAL